MHEMDDNTTKTNTEAMNSNAVFDAFSNSKRVKRCYTGNDLVESSARKDDIVEEIDTSSPALGRRPWKQWKQLNNPRGEKFGKAALNSSSFTLNSLGKGNSIRAQNRVGNVNGKNKVIISPDEANSFHFQRSDMRIKRKEAESKGNNHRQNFAVMGPSISNSSMMKQPDVIASSSKKGKELSSYLDAGLKSRMKENVIIGGNGLKGRVDEVMPKPSYLFSSGMNKGRAKTISNEHVDKAVYMDLSEGVTSHELYSKHSHSDKKKGALHLEDDSPKDIQYGEPAIRSCRAVSLLEKAVVTIADDQDSSFESYQNFGWRKAHDFKINMNQLSHSYPSNYKEKLSSSHLLELRQEADIKDRDHANVIYKSSQIFTQDQISNPHHDQSFPCPMVSRRNHSWKKNVKGKKNCNSLQCNFGETSGSNLNQPSYPQSHARTSNLKLEKRNKNRCHGTTSIEIDELYPEAKYCNSHGQQNGVSDDSSARANQIESDKIFARKLQEQFYHETTRFIDMEKVDETIAWSLQQDEDAKASTLAWKGHSNSQVLFDEIRSKLDAEVNLETRLDLWEAMEDLLENSDILEGEDLASNHSFNDSTDYEMQLTFDESNRQHIDFSAINNLPLSFIQNDEYKEACAICLEIPSVGEAIRHLPCLHKFHKLCVDAWLKRKPSCPICKFSITYS